MIKCQEKEKTYIKEKMADGKEDMPIGFDVKSLSEILGHASVNITLNKYVHPSMELKQKNMNMISDLLAVK